MMKILTILGTRGVPAAHGGFETFAEQLALRLVAQGWQVRVYCQEYGEGEIWESQWNQIQRIHIPVRLRGAFGTVLFDLRAAYHARRLEGLLLTLGYNTALFNVIQRVMRQTNIINMDGVEWRRDKWGIIAKTWFWMNERLGCWFGDHLVADHPEIENHLATRTRRQRITMIPYGAHDVKTADGSLLKGYGITPRCFSVIIARPEPENSILEMVSAFSKEKRNHKLVVLGNFSPETNKYHRRVLDSASDEVLFIGAVYEQKVVEALRFFCRFYLHGHRVGGTNPSLVEAMGAGCAVIAHDNKFNRWVVGDGAVYFADENRLGSIFDDMLRDDVVNEQLRAASKKRFLDCFTWDRVLKQYEDLLLDWYPKEKGSL